MFRPSRWGSLRDSEEATVGIPVPAEALQEQGEAVGTKKNQNCRVVVNKCCCSLKPLSVGVVCHAIAIHTSVSRNSVGPWHKTNVRGIGFGNEHCVGDSRRLFMGAGRAGRERPPKAGDKRAQAVHRQNQCNALHRHVPWRKTIKWTQQYLRSQRFQS